MKKFLSLICAVGLLASISLPASAASYSYDPYSDPYYDGIDWSQIDTSMCVPGTEYHRSTQPSIVPLDASYRPVFAGWVRGVPANTYPATSTYCFVTSLSFQADETGMVRVTFTDSQDPSKSDINISIYDKSDQVFSDYFQLSYDKLNSQSKSFYVNPSHEYNLYISHQGTGLQNERIIVEVG